jgi:hypothetical protein
MESTHPRQVGRRHSEALVSTVDAGSTDARDPVDASGPVSSFNFRPLPRFSDGEQHDLCQWKGLRIYRYLSNRCRDDAEKDHRIRGERLKDILQPAGEYSPAGGTSGRSLASLAKSDGAYDRVTGSGEVRRLTICCARP